MRMCSECGFRAVSDEEIYQHQVESHPEKVQDQQMDSVEAVPDAETLADESRRREREVWGD